MEIWTQDELRGYDTDRCDPHYDRALMSRLARMANRAERRKARYQARQLVVGVCSMDWVE